MFIVEGINDQVCLEGVLHKLFERTSKVRFQITDGDLLSDKHTTSTNIKNKIGDVIHSHLNLYGLQKKDLIEVVQLIDTDGTFISDDRVLLKAGIDRTIYTDDCILANNPPNIVLRNHSKADLIKKIYQMPKIMGIPYSMYYFSCNMDHVFHGNANLSREAKFNAASDFDDRHHDSPDAFLQLIAHSDFTVPGDYEDSWAFIMEGSHSLACHSKMSCYFSQKQLF